jgi:endoglucanase
MHLSNLHFLSGFLTLFLLFGSFQPMSAQKDLKNKFEIKRGVNISHWLSQSSRRGPERDAYLQQSDIKFIKAQGFDHVRIPIDEEQMWDEKGNKEKKAFELLHAVLNWCDDSGLKAIVDLHILRSHHFNQGEKPLWTEESAQNKFYQCWRELSEELITYPVEDLAYELMNEAVAENPEDWNMLAAKALKVVRKNEPNRKILIGSNRWQSTETFGTLKIPDDPNIIISFHFYEPFLLTHHQASWTSIKDYKGPVKYPGKSVEASDLAGYDAETREKVEDHNGVFTKETLKARILKPLLYAKDRGLQVYCGEWGCRPTVPRKDFITWYRDMRSILEELDIAWTIWDYKGGFGIVDQDNKPVKDLIKVLTKESIK